MAGDMHPYAIDLATAVLKHKAGEQLWYVKRRKLEQKSDVTPTGRVVRWDTIYPAAYSAYRVFDLKWDIGTHAVTVTYSYPKGNFTESTPLHGYNYGYSDGIVDISVLAKMRLDGFDIELAQ